MSSPANLSGCMEATTTRLSMLGLVGKPKSISDPPGFKISLPSKTPNTREFMLDMLNHKACFASVVLLHKLVQSVPRVYVTEFIRARLKEHELESRLLKSRASHFEQLALLHQKHSRAVLEREMYQHANKLSFPSTATIPPRGRVQWKTTATDNALCWVLDAHGKQCSSHEGPSVYIPTRLLG
ncbi:hypothetical protein FIBSPDRAFT_904068 [Athelia psychrophila]|uniref:Uncharacterized protein n=1 Tax=Athelia psychrophila TaxID=1759441 RepID=A0A167V7C4_9AGAM|nr:hypothetical protein FIBSPDRAFT_904535 [Fibularhizoctonia sp. CBS 109695]KZP04717.1 hypothetical protein FIBSPDRAFT_904068 [Fibularhizoctonia sp. CBS 109695]